MTLFKLGSKEKGVAIIQQALGISNDGIFGSETEKKVKEYQMSKGLVADGIVGEKTIKVLMLEYIKSFVDFKPIYVHIKDRTAKVKYIVIHFTAGSSSKKGSALTARNCFTGSRLASADFCIDDETVVQVNPNLDKKYTFAVGDGRGLRGITNQNSVSIEICSNRKQGTTMQVPNHEGWFFTEKELDLAEKLTEALMLYYGISIDNVKRHFDASGKLCPGIIGWNDGRLYDIYGRATKNYNNSSEWLKFKNRLK